VNDRWGREIRGSERWIEEVERRSEAIIITTEEDTVTKLRSPGLSVLA
jgi:hypothetical protein